MKELLDRCRTVDEVTTGSDNGPEEYANDGTSSVTWLMPWPEQTKQGVASALKDQFKEDFKQNPSDNAENSSKSIASDFPDWHKWLSAV